MDQETQPIFNPGEHIVSVAIKLLNNPNPTLKAEQTHTATQLFINQQHQQLTHTPHGTSYQCPENPAQYDKLTCVHPSRAPKRGKGGSLASRQAMVHSLCHIECCAIDLAWDIIARFGSNPAYSVLPREFYEDFAVVAEDEARHFLALQTRLNDLGIQYGDLPVHSGLWESAMATAHSLPARLAVEHATHEARGLDILPQTIHRFRSNKDEETAGLLEKVIYPEEIDHCGKGVKWLKFLYDVAVGTENKNEKNKEESIGCSVVAVDEGLDWVVDARQYESVAAWFRALVRRHFHGNLKPPFNVEARRKAGFTEDWYMPLAENDVVVENVVVAEEGAVKGEVA